MDDKTAPRLILLFLLVLPSLPQFVLALRNPVQTSTGPVVGTVFQYKCKLVQAFLGIPYAEPPVGNLRFKKTVPKDPSSELLVATDFPPACIQAGDPNNPAADGMPNQSEDCLYLNVWVPPNTTEFSKKAVMFWIFSGGFRVGSNRIPVYHGQVLAAEGDVIVVTINYRLSILGFISAKTDEAPGNMGFYDILEALKWVKRNIGAFGGDGDNITLFGHSAGGWSSGSLCVSPLANGLFKRAILQSGSPAYNWTDNTELNANLAQKVATAVGCASDVDNFSVNPDGVIRCLRTKDPRELIELSKKLKGYYLVGFSSIVGDEFLPIDPNVQLKRGLFNDVDIMIGNTQDELSYKLVSAEFEYLGFFGQKNPQINRTAGEKCIRSFFQGFPGEEIVVQYYLRGLEEDDYDAVREQTYHSLGDFVLSCPDMYFAESYAKKGRVYAYYFNHIPSGSPWEPWMGSVHFDEVAFVYGRPLDHPFDYTLAERCLSRRLIRIWTTFAKTGYPGEEWPKFSRANPYFKIFNISNRKSYLEELKKNCDIFRPFNGYM